MDTAFACAKHLYDRNIHPRVLLGPDDVLTLKRRIHSGKGKKIMDALRRATHPHVKTVLESDDFGGLGVAHDMAMIGILDDDQRAIDAVKRVIDRLPEAVARNKGDKSKDDILVHGALSPALFAFDLIYHHLTSRQRRAFMRWVIESQVREIIAMKRPAYYKCAGMNLMLGKIPTAIYAILAFRGEPGAPSLKAEMKELVSFFEASLNTAISSDGYPEEDTGYGTHFLSLLFQAAEALRRAGEFDAMTACPRLAKSGRALLHLIEPWGDNLAQTGDGSDTFHFRQYILPRLATLTSDPVILWLFGALHESKKELALYPRFHVPVDAATLISVDDLTEPVSPDKAKVSTGFVDRGRGFVSFRSGWEANDTLVVFDGAQRSPAAQGHFHASCGHFSLSALGEYFAIDTGRYHIEQDQHNLVLVDGKSGRSTNGEWKQCPYHGNLIDYLPGEFADFAAVDSSHQHDCYWARRYLCLVKGKGAPAYVWTVEDVNKANDYREFWWTLNTSPANTIRTASNHATAHGSRRGNMLDISFVLPPATSYTRPHTLSVTQDIKMGGSYKYLDAHAWAAKYDNPEDMIHWSVFKRPRLIAKVAGWNGRFMSLMIPRRRGDKPAKARRIPSLDNSLAAKITFPTVEDTIIFAYEHNMLEAGDIKGRGQWCVVRQSRKTGRVLAHALGHGTDLHVAGKNLMK